MREAVEPDNNPKHYVTFSLSGAGFIGVIRLDLGEHTRLRNTATSSVDSSWRGPCLGIAV